MSITNQALPITHNRLVEKYMQIVKNLFYKAKEEGKDLYKCLMVYCNTPLSNSLSSPMQILTSRSARSSLSMSHAARKQKGLDCENFRTHCKNEHLPMHDLHLQHVMYQETQLARDGIMQPLTSCAKSPEATGGSRLSRTAVKPDSCLARIFFLQNLVSFFLYNLM